MGRGWASFDTWCLTKKDRSRESGLCCDDVCQLKLGALLDLGLPDVYDMIGDGAVDLHTGQAVRS